MKSVINTIITNLFLIYGSIGGFYFAFQFGAVGRRKKIPLVPRLIIALIVVALAITLFFLIPALLDTINKNINTSINKNIDIYTIVMLIINTCLALYLLLIDFIKKSETLESPVHRGVNFSLSLCLVLYAGIGFLPVIPGNFKGTFRNSHFIILLAMTVTFLVYALWIFIRERMGRNKIFISYRRKDSADITGRIVDRLIAKFGSTNILRDVDSIPLGVNFANYIDKLLQSTSVCLVVIGKKWLSLCNSKSERENTESIDFVQVEIETALMQRLPIIPVLLQNAIVPSKDQLPKSIDKLSFQNGIAIRPDPDFNLDIERLILGIKEGICKMKKMRRTYEYKKMMKARVQAKSGRKSKRK
ncbi:MAG: toll/interleukin-1 receptor domain-containing protein [Spirochaetales bacterium]|nr:toll/interleukin-1 receptor domain-containing protein [Spirochaetales bacterium]